MKSYEEIEFSSILEYAVDPFFYCHEYKDVGILSYSPVYHYYKYNHLLKRRRFEPKSYLCEANKKYPVYVGMASMPSRVKKLEKVISNILPQVNHVYIYLNNYDSVPEFLTDDKITIFSSSQFGDLKDNGKFFGLQYLEEDCYFISIDDDINYPENYVSELVKKIDLYDKKCVVGLHGAIYGKLANSFFDRKTIHFSKELSFDTPVSVLGTGTVGFFKRKIPISLDDFETTGKADLYLGSFLKKRKIPAICISRERNWLSELEDDENTGPNIYQQTKRNSQPYDEIIKNSQPWGYGEISNALKFQKIEWHNVGGYLIQKMDEAEKNNKITLDYNAALCIYQFSLMSKMEFANKTALESIIDEYFSCVCDISSLDRKASDSFFKKVDEIKKKRILSSFSHGDKNVFPSLKDLEIDARKNNLYSSSAKIKLMQYMRGERSVYDVFSSAFQSGDSWIASWLYDEVLNDLEKFSDDKLVELAWMLCRLKFYDLAEKAIDQIQKRKINSVAAFKAELYYLVDVGCKEKIEEVLLKVFNAKGKKKEKHLDDILKYLIGTNSKIEISNEEGWYNICCLGINNPIKLAFVFIYLIEGHVSDRVYDLLLDSLCENDSMDSKIVKKEILDKKEKNSVFSNKTVSIYNELSGLPDVKDISLKNKERNFLDSLSKANVKPLSSGGGEYLVSVILCTYNDLKTIQYAYDSVVNQSYKNVEIIIVDDCSEVEVESYLSVNLDVSTHILRNEINVGPYESRNVGLQKAQGELVAFHDADDWCHPQKIENQVRAMSLDENKNIFAVYNKHLRVDHFGRIMPENNLSYIGDGPITAMFRKEVFKEFGLFLNVRTRGDVEFKRRLNDIAGPTSILEQGVVSILALDWMSNSKKYNLDNDHMTVMTKLKSDFASLQSILKSG